MRSELTRREFLHSSAVGSAGLVIAFYLPTETELHAARNAVFIPAECLAAD